MNIFQIDTKLNRGTRQSRKAKRHCVGIKSDSFNEIIPPFWTDMKQSQCLHTECWLLSLVWNLTAIKRLNFIHLLTRFILSFFKLLILFLSKQSGKSNNNVCLLLQQWITSYRTVWMKQFFYDWLMNHHKVTSNPCYSDSFGSRKLFCFLVPAVKTQVRFRLKFLRS